MLIVYTANVPGYSKGIKVVSESKECAKKLVEKAVMAYELGFKIAVLDNSVYADEDSLYYLYEKNSEIVSGKMMLLPLIKLSESDLKLEVEAFKARDKESLLKKFFKKLGRELKLHKTIV